MSTAASITATKTSHVPILLESLRIDTVLDFDLFLKVNDTLVLYRSADLPFTEETRRKLLDNRVERLYIAGESQSVFQRYMEKNLPHVLNDPEVQEDKKASILYETSTNLVKDVLEKPTYGDNIRRSRNLVTNTVGFILKGRDAFLHLLKITSFDYYTYTHSVNVCTFSVALARQIGHSDEQCLNELGVGALLHDIGKSRVPPRILNKRTKLSPAEFEIMKRHPGWGAEILSKTDEVTPPSYYPVLQHHERGDRSGYPAGLSLDEMHLYSRIAAIADSFDAMTTERVYQKAVETFPALQTMVTQTDAYDEALLHSFIELMGPSGLAQL